MIETCDFEHDFRFLEWRNDYCVYKCSRCDIEKMIE